MGERIRASYHNLPCEAIPHIVIDCLSVVSAQQLNLFLAKGGVSEYFSPHALLTGTDIDYKKHCVVPFGTHVQANQKNDPSNTDAPRTIDVIYLRPMQNIQGGHEVMNLQTGQVITRNTAYERPLTPLVIKAVEELTSKQQIKTLKITGRNSVPICPADWIEGVDYAEVDMPNNA